MLFDRVISLVVGQSGGKGVEISGLRIEFSVEKTSTETLNNSTISIYNLSTESQKLVETPNNAVILKAGYAQDVGAKVIFVGIVRRSLTVRDGSDWVTKLELDDGLIAYRDSKKSYSFPAGISAVSVLKSVANGFGLPVRQFPEITDKTYKAGFSFVGKNRDAMGKVCTYLGLEWSIQNQEIQVLVKGKAKKRTAVVLNENTGLVGSPALEAKTLSDKAAAKEGITVNTAGVIKRRSATKDGEIETKLEVQGYKVDSLLLPMIEPGDLVKLESKGIDGFFKVEKLVHAGSNYGDKFNTTLTLRFI